MVPGQAAGNRAYPPEGNGLKTVPLPTNAASRSAGLQQIERVERGLEAPSAEHEVASEPQVENLQIRGFDLPRAAVRIREPDRGRQRIRHHPAVRERDGWRAEPRIRRAQPGDDRTRIRSRLHGEV